MALFFGRTKEQTRKVSLFRQVLAGIPGTAENRAHKAKVAFLAQITDREAERRAIIAKYDLAVDDGDTRRQHETWQDAFAATCAALRAEVGR